MSSNFKIKNKKVNNEQQRATLDYKHNEMIKHFESLSKSINAKKKRIKHLDLTLNGLEDCDVCPELVSKRLSIQEERNNLVKEINNIENKEEENKYYLDNAELIFQYFDNINELANNKSLVKIKKDDEKPKKKKKETEIAPEKEIYKPQVSNITNEVFYQSSKTNSRYKPTKKYRKKDLYEPSGTKDISSFFGGKPTNNEDDDDENDDDIEEKTEDVQNNRKNFNINDYIERKENFQRGRIFERFMSKVEPTFNISSQRDESIDMCQQCGIEKTINYNEGLATCEQCGSCDFLKIDCDKRSYKDPPPEMSYFAYKRINHFREWLAQFQAKETTDIPQNVYDTLWLEIKKNRITDMRKLNPTKLREFLKKHKLNKYYEHIPHIIYKLNGVPPPVITKDVEERLCNAFKDIQGPFAKVCPKNRKNFLSYSYVLYKFSQLLELDNLSSGFTLLKSKEKLNNQDQIWRKICQELNWQYIDTVY